MRRSARISWEKEAVRQDGQTRRQQIKIPNQEKKLVSWKLRRKETEDKIREMDERPESREIRWGRDVTESITGEL
jgi:protein subunit release factor B